MAPEIKKESEEDVGSTNTSLNCSATNFTIKNSLDIKPTIKKEVKKEEYCNRDGLKRSFSEMNDVKEEKESIDLNLGLTLFDSKLKDRLSSNKCSEISSTSSCMPPNNQDSSSEEVELTNRTTSEKTYLVVVGCWRCYMYVMVPGNDPKAKCPRCNTSDVIDIFRTKPGKKSKNA